MFSLASSSRSPTSLTSTRRTNSSYLCCCSRTARDDRDGSGASFGFLKCSTGISVIPPEFVGDCSRARNLIAELTKNSINNLIVPEEHSHYAKLKPVSWLGWARLLDSMRGEV